MHSDPLALARLRDAETHQLTTYDLDRMKKVPVDRGQTVVLGEVDGRGHIAQLWLTFPGWFWQNWNVDAPISPTILKTLILRIYWDGSDRPAATSSASAFAKSRTSPRSTSACPAAASTAASPCPSIKTSASK